MSSLVLLTTLLMTGSIAHGKTTTTRSPTTTSPTTTTTAYSGSLNPSHLYQLQGATYSSLLASNYTHYVVDPDDSALTPAQVAALKAQGKVILAYVCVGYAENYRDFWNASWTPGNPSWLGAEQPDWPGNYWVEYWDPAWQKINLNFISGHILAKGYSGIYMDGIDTYQYYEDLGNNTAAQGMVNYVALLRNETQAIQPGTLIFPQNAVELYGMTGYPALVDGFGKEDTWFNDDDTQDPSDIAYDLSFMTAAKSAGKLILSIDYPTEQPNICAYYEDCFAQGFSCTDSDRNLDMGTPYLC